MLTLIKANEMKIGDYVSVFYGGQTVNYFVAIKAKHFIELSPATFYGLKQLKDLVISRDCEIEDRNGQWFVEIDESFYL